MVPVHGDLAFGTVGRQHLTGEYSPHGAWEAKREEKEGPGFPGPLHGHTPQLPNFIPLGPTS